MKRWTGFFQVTREVAKCKCPKRFQVEQIGANKYRVSGFLPVVGTVVQEKQENFNF